MRKESFNIRLIIQPDFGEMISDKTCSSGDQDFHEFPVLFVGG